MGIQPVGMLAHQMCAWCPQRLKKGIGSSETEVTVGYEPLCRFWEMNPVPLEEQPVLLTADLSLQSNNFFLPVQAIW